MKSIRRNKLAAFFAFAIPSLLIYILFVTVPFLKTFYYSLTDWNGISDSFNFIGLANFQKLLQDKILWKSLVNNIEICLLGGFLTFLIAIFNAVIITQSKLRERKFYRIVYFIPNILSATIVSLLWMFIYNPNFGLLNGFLEGVGLENLTKVWLGNKATVIPCIIIAWVWMSVGFYMILYISAIEGIPTSLFEAAEIDGSNFWHKFRYITWPLLKETTKTALVFFFVNAFSSVFNMVKIMTDGDPARASEVLTNYMYKTAFRQSSFGYATAIGVFTFLVILLLSGVMLLLTRTKDTIEY